MNFQEMLNERDKKNEIFNESTILSSSYLKLVSDISSIKSRLNTMNTRHSELVKGGAVFGNEADITQLNSQLVSLYREKETLSNELKKNSEEVSLLEGLYQKSSSELADLKKKQQILEVENTNLATERISIEQKLDSVIAEINAVTSKYEEISTLSASLSEVINEYKRKIKESSQIIKESEKDSPHSPLQKFYAKFDIHSSQINSVIFGPNYESIITVGEDKKLIQMGFPNMNEIINVPTRASVNNLSLQKEAGLICLSCNDKAVRILDLSTGRIITELSNHTDVATDCQWISRNQVLSSSKDRTVKIFDLTKNAVNATIMATSAVSSICQTEQPAVFAGACNDGVIRLFDIRTKKVAQKIDKVHTKGIVSLAMSPSGDIIYSLGLDGAISETSISGGAKLRSRQDPNLEVKSQMAKISVSKCGGFVFVPSTKGRGLLFDMLTNSPPSLLNHGNGDIICSSFASNLLITGDTNHSLYFWVN